MRPSVSGQSDGWATVAPPDCAFAVGLPLTREDFDYDLAHPEQADYVPGLMRKYSGVAADFVWERYYAPLALALCQHCDALEALGVTVCRAVSYQAFRDLLAPGRFKVITLFSHSRWAEVTAADIPNVGAFLLAVRDRIAEGSPFASELGQLLEIKFPGILALPDAGNVPEDLGSQIVDRIREVVRESQAFYEKDAFGEVTDPVLPTTAPLSRLWRAVKLFFGNDPAPHAAPRHEFRDFLPGRLITRALLEHHLPRVVVPRWSVEFRRALVTSAQFLNAIPAEFSGVLDLCFCSSALHGAGMADPNRPFLVMASRYSNQPHFQLPIHQAVMEELRQCPQPYLAAQMTVRKVLIEGLG